MFLRSPIQAISLLPRRRAVGDGLERSRLPHSGAPLAAPRPKTTAECHDGYYEIVVGYSTEGERVRFDGFSLVKRKVFGRGVGLERDTAAAARLNVDGGGETYNAVDDLDISRREEEVLVVVLVLERGD
jgi:hypothetical protein